jgi:hypothetical protein
MKISIGFFCIVLLFTSCYAQTENDLVDSWSSRPIPTNRDSIRKYSKSSDKWTVFLKDGKVHVTSMQMKSELPPEIEANKDEKIKFRGQSSFLTVDDGYLVGSYRGEWGGNLFWYSNDGKKHYEISDDEVVQFIKREGKNYAIQGLAHLGSSEGSIINIEKVGGKWTAKEYLKLPKAPEAIALDSKNNFIIVTSKSLIKVDSNFNVTTLVERGLWYEGSDPTGLIIYNDIVYFGMRGGIYKFNLLTGAQEWLVK